MLMLGVVIAIVGSVSMFNLETRQTLDKHGLPGSYFGYSVAGHSQRGTGNITKWILVGAPLGQNMQPASNRSGALFRCPISVAHNDCVQVVTDGYRTDDIDDDNNNDGFLPEQRLEPPGLDEIKTNQWLGVTVETGGKENKIFVCAHRYIKISKPQPFSYASKAADSDSPGLYLGQGVCYVLNEDFSFSFAVEVCRGRSIEREHQQYAFCQSGTSGAVLADGTALIGTPGAMTWKGTLFNVAIEGDFLSRDKFQYYAPHDNVHSPVPNYSYLGMSVTGGRFFGEHMTYAGGAPRAAQGNGEVVIFSNRNRKNPFDHIVSLIGEQFGSGFGSAIAATDVNGDGLPDLFVGAPNYFNRTDGGAVYVYLNRGNSFDQTYDQRLTGRLESRFGTAIANCGDLNRDGLNDVAIGAPYEATGRGRVYIYFGTINGLSAEPAQTIDPPDSFAKPSDWRTFGSSLAGTHDLDGNSYPDLIVGSYGSDRVTALLARPIINIRTYEELKDENGVYEPIDPTKNGCFADRATNVTCFTFRACSSVDDAFLASNDGDALNESFLFLRFTIKAETFLNDRKFSRVYFGMSQNDSTGTSVTRTNVLNKRFRLATSASANETDKTFCHAVTAYLKEGTRDIQNPIQFRINYTLDEEQRDASASNPMKNRLPRLEPILNRTAAERIFTVPFQKDCGADGICRSALFIQDIQLVGLTSNGSDTYFLVLGRDRTLTLTLKVLNRADSAYETHLYVQHDSSLTYAGAKGSSICGAHNISMVDCSIGNPLKRNGEKLLALRFDARSLEETGYGRGANGPTQTISLVIFMNTTSRDGDLKPKYINLRIVRTAKLGITGVAQPEQVFYGGGGVHIVGESAIQSLDEIGKPVKHVFQMFNDGPWRAPAVKLMIDWPLQVANNKPQGKWLLYLDALPTLEISSARDAGQDRSFCNVLRKPEITGEGSPVNPLGLRSSSTKSNYSPRASRVRRDRAMVLRPSAADGAIQMDCLSQTAKCVRIVCDIYDLGPKAQALVSITARLWNTTLVGDYPRVDVVRIGSSAHYTVEGLDDIDVPETLMVRTEAFPEMGPPVIATNIPWWFIALAVIGGLILLAAVTYVLSRLGFFRRKRHTGEDPTLSGNLERRQLPKSTFDSVHDSHSGAERKPFMNRRS
ncbi:integrin alpha-PS1 [Anopheles bellator]|uniref:integrin alpha-PS1 n=1 Tax=Anopheles bellator TaxID=139047 RepID=UPI00264A3E31|nr:integrin alpha-PS1 [Anopheles bellator]